MTRFRKTSGTAGRVVFVGAGPGDPGMLTARATAALGRGSTSSSSTPTSRPPSRTPSARRTPAPS